MTEKPRKEDVDAVFLRLLSRAAVAACLMILYTIFIFDRLAGMVARAHALSRDLARAAWTRVGALYRRTRHRFPDLGLSMAPVPPRDRSPGDLASSAGSALALAAAVGLAIMVRVPDCEAEGCPRVEALSEYRPPEAAHYYDRDGRLVGHLPGTVRMWENLEEFPPLLRQAIVSVEDHRFYEHHGVDVSSVLRAAVANVKAGGIAEGASTITMQLVRNLWEPALGKYGPWRRKLTEARLAQMLERRFGKDRILELYLNQVYLGRGIYGFGAAARHYYEKPVGELTLGEITMLVGAVKTPERYNPRTGGEGALTRRSVVLDLLVEAGAVTEAEADAVRDEPLNAIDTGPLVQGRSYFAAAVRRELLALVPDASARTGLRVFTTLDPEVQRSLDRRIGEQVARIESGAYGAFRHPVPEDGALPRAEGLSAYLQGAGVALDIRSGEVRAVTGGREFEHSEFDRAILASRQPGSTFKPVVYAAGLTAGEITLADILDTSPIEMEVLREVWRPADAQASDSLMSVREALARSSNWAAVRVGRAVGVGAMAQTAARLGIRSPVAPVPASFLGASSLRPVELVAAFAAFGNGGSRVEPHLITRIEDAHGRIVYRATPSVEVALPPTIAFLTRQGLEGVVNGGTGWRARAAGYWGPAAGKTGTTDESKDAWFVGFNGELALGIWLGFDRPKEIVRNAYGGTIAAPVWGAVMFDIYGSGRDAPGFPRPPRELRRIRIDTETGFAVSEDCDAWALDTRIEYFVRGTEPPALCASSETRARGRIGSR